MEVIEVQPVDGLQLLAAIQSPLLGIDLAKQPAFPGRQYLGRMIIYGNLFHGSMSNHEQGKERYGNQ
ncbi:MAG: hypothetical protein UH853_07645 [Muribaculaceae bacterium]|nr:hypothetical protein [Muribaculaceae bacterium]